MYSLRILIVTTEPLPLPGFIPSGAGLRIWGIAQGLHAKSFEVEIAMATDAVQKAIPEQYQGIYLSTFLRDHLTRHVRAARCDVLVMQHWGLMDRLGKVDCPLAIDLAGPHLLERYYWGTPSLQRDLEQKLNALQRADFLCCSGDYQRKYFLSYVLQAGFDMADPHLLPIVPFSVCPDLPVEREHDPLNFIYCGMLLPWQDPHAGIQALLKVLESKKKGHFWFIGGRHPSNDVSMGKFDNLIEAVKNSPFASVEAARSFGELDQILSRCGVALDLMARNPERELAFTSRTVVYLSHGLPVIHDDYSELSRLINRYDAGWCLDPHNIDAIETLIESLIKNPEEIERRRPNARQLVRENLTWDQTIEPLARWCADPMIRENKESIPSNVEQILRLRLELAESQGKYNELAGRRLVKISNFLRRLGLRKGHN